jgi:multidrug resistance efflux pump
VSGDKVSAARSGRVIEVKFHLGARVKQGDVLIRLDTERIDNDIKSRRRTIAAASSELTELDKQREFLAKKYAVDRSKAESELEQAREEVRQAQLKRAAKMDRAEAELMLAEHDEAMLRRLVNQRAAAPADFKKATSQAGVARANLKEARIPVDESRVQTQISALEQVEKEYDLKRSELEMKREAKQREVKTTESELANLELDRKDAVVYAHTDGVVTWGEVRIGDTLDAGKAVLAIAEERGFRVDVAVPDLEMGHVHEGMPVRVRLDAYDYQRYGTITGTVYQISPDSQRLEGQPAAIFVVKATLDTDQVGHGEYRGQAKFGMMGQAEIVTGQESILSLLVKKVRQTISLG